METKLDTESSTQQFESCDECGSPVERTQRYCVVCGTRRKHATDPAVRYLSGAAGRARAAGQVGGSAGAAGPASATGRRAPRRRGGIGTAVAIAVVPIAVALGVIVGRAGNGTDAKLLAALKAQKAEVVNIQSGAAGAAGTGSSTSTKAAKGSSKNGNGTGKALSKTNYGTFNSVTGLKTPSQSTLNQNAAIVKRVQGQINKSYVNSQKNLPNVISVP